MDCRHVWTLAEGGNAMFRWRKCYAKKQTADAAIKRWTDYAPNGGHRPAPSTGVYMVRQCDNKKHPGTCPCACRPV